ncbi:MAG: saccharopine dehydrogenase NADP-binding domain-containing protein [Pseudomonadales bacterium]|nr:saccharopine dehydrogenase NADP-binding domain-containing protein [Pseudomonadales bacterium]
MSSDREFDVVLLGATGFTGKLVAEFLAETYGTGQTLNWALAGRNQAKLESVRAGLGEEAASLPLIIVDSSDASALNEMAARTRVICTTVGPYALHGSKVVEACVDQGTHYCDLTGEVQWMYRMIEQFQSRAEASGARIVHTCGFDSIPSDLGVLFTQNQMQAKHGVYGDSVKFRVADSRGGVSGGTIASMMNMMEEVREDPSIRDIINDPYALNPLNMPRGEDGPDQLVAMYDADFKAWTAPFVMAAINTRVVRRSHALMGYPWGKQFRYDEAMLTGPGPQGYLKAVAIAAGSVMTMLGAAFGPVRSMMKSLLPAQGEGPSLETRESGYFDIEFYAANSSASDKCIKVRVTGDKDPGYGATARMLGESAVCLAKDSLETGGGFWTPATAMGDRLIQRLQANAGMKFTVL